MAQLSRRELLGLALSGAAALLTAACGGQSAAVPELPVMPTVASLLATPTPAPPTPTPAPTATPLPPTPLLVNPRFRRQDTPATNALSADGYTWAQGRPLIVDRRDAIIAVAQCIRAVNGTQTYAHAFVFSNDGGATWRENAADIGGMSRASLAYDDANDIIHTLWRGQNEADAVLYRRYTIARDPDGGVREIAADPTGDRRLDGRSGEAPMTFEHPIIHWLSGEEIGNRYGAVLCVWSAHNGARGRAGNEIRASMRVLDNSAADGDAGGWAAPGEPSATTIGNPPAVPYTALVANAAPGVAYPSLGRKRAGSHRGDLYLCYADGGAGEYNAQRWCWRRFPWRADALRWAGGTPEAILAPMRRSGIDRGYDQKGQLGTKLVEDPASDRVYFGFTTWKDDAAGDTWNFAYIGGDDAPGPIVDVYSCNGRFQPELYALTGDLAFDTRYGRLIVAYIRSGAEANHGVLRVYDGVTPTEPELRFFTGADVDIPLLWQDERSGRCRYGGGAIQKLLVLFRDTNGQAPPYRGWFGTLDWAGR